MAFDICAIEALVDLMRRRGIISMTHEGTAIVLGPEPRTVATAPATTPAPLSLDDIRRELQRQQDAEQQEQDEVLFAATRGMRDQMAARSEQEDGAH